MPIVIFYSQSAPVDEKESFLAAPMLAVILFGYLVPKHCENPLYCI
jgi:hypothetical protein